MVRVKHRYFLVQILYPDATPFKTSDPDLPDRVRFHQPTPDAITAGFLLGQIRDQLAALYGDYGSGVAGTGLTIKYFSNATSTFILCSPRGAFRLVWAALSMMTSIPVPGTKMSGKQDVLTCVLRVLRISGTIRKAEEGAIQAAKQSILRATERDSATGGELLDKLLPRVGVEMDRDEDMASEESRSQGGMSIDET